VHEYQTVGAKPNCIALKAVKQVFSVIPLRCLCDFKIVGLDEHLLDLEPMLQFLQQRLILQLLLLIINQRNFIFFFSFRPLSNDNLRVAPAPTPPSSPPPQQTWGTSWLGGGLTPGQGHAVQMPGTSLPVYSHSGGAGPQPDLTV
jgi:hypothetical protein